MLGRGEHHALPLVTVRQGFRMAGIQSEQAQQFGKGLPAVRHHKVLAGDQQVQTGRVVPGPRAFSGVLAVNADVKAQRAGLNGFGHGQDRLAQLLSQISGLLPAPVQPAQDQRENGFQSQQGEDFCQHRVRHLRQVKTVALERAHEVFGIHLIRNGAQLRQEGVKLLRPVFPCQAEDPLQLVAVNRTVVLNLPGQQVAGDVEQRAMGRKCGQLVLAANIGPPAQRPGSAAHPGRPERYFSRDPLQSTARPFSVCPVLPQCVSVGP